MPCVHWYTYVTVPPSFNESWVKEDFDSCVGNDGVTLYLVSPFTGIGSWVDFRGRSGLSGSGLPTVYSSGSVSLVFHCQSKSAVSL